ncbi:MAG: 16S rRNA (adenine(1518)-N(6)/adenine(1519)-N(6))-dimethyltransferase RsmA [Cyclobacteriaceae bacterium]
MKSVRPKKYLGQHFLKDENIALKIVEALQMDHCSTVLEIGPGTGVLTRHLFELEQIDFFALDVDGESVRYLQDNYPAHKSKVLLADFLKFPLEEFDSTIAVIGNFPYNISSQIFFKIWENHHRIDEVVCMVQKEVAQRLASKPGNKTYGILSVLLQAFYDIEYLFTVPPGVFNPPPKVHSAVIRLKRNQTKQLACNHLDFKKVVKTAFGKRRKTLRNALKDLNLAAQISNEKVFDQRAEQLSVSEFVGLTIKVFSND